MVRATQSKKVRRRSVRLRIMPMAIRFGGEPTGTPTATLEDQVSINRKPVGNRLRVGSPILPRAPRIPVPTGSIIAVVAVLLTQSEMDQVTAPIVARRRDGDRVVHG
jgi:hypothetical protein